MKPKFAPFALVLAVAALLSVPVGAPAVHWPNFGGDAGRSSHQPVDPPVMPIKSKYRVADSNIRTSIITSAGGPATVQRMIYGAIRSTSNTDFGCFVHVRILATGAAVGAANGVDVCPTGSDPNTGFGDTTARDTVTPVESSSAGGLGQIFVVHNDTDSAATPEDGELQSCSASTNDIAIAQIDETDGTLVKDVAVGRPAEDNPINACGDDSAATHQISDGFTIKSSPLITPANSNGDRDIFFLAASPTITRLYKVHVTNAASKQTSFSFSYVNVAGANVAASPALAYFRDPTRGGVPSQYVVVPAQGAASDGLSSFRTNDLSAGPVVPEATTSGTDTPWTPAIPTNAQGLLPGQAGSGSDVTPSIYVPYETTDGKTIVRRFEQKGDSQQLTRVGQTPGMQNPSTLDSPALAGRPSRAIALRQTAIDGGTQAGGRVVVTTESDAYALNADSLALLHEYRDGPGEPDQDPATGGFRRTVPMVAGDFAYVNQNNGFPLVLQIDPVEPSTDGMERVCFAGDTRPACAGKNEFTEHPDNSLSTFAIGQGSISRNLIQLATDRGVFVYEAVDPTNAPAVVNITTEEGTKLRGNAEESRVTAEASDPDGGIVRVDFYLAPGCAAGDSKPAESKIATDPTAPYSATFNTAECAEGNHTLRAVAVSGNSPDAEDSITVEIDNKADPTASFTIAPDNEEPSGTEFTFDASASAASAAERSLVTYEWDWESDGTVDFSGNADQAKVARHTYGTPGTYDVTLRVVQDDGEDDGATSTVTVTNRPPVASFAVNPNPATAGQQVEFDASASQDPDGQISTYDWDFDGDGKFDQTTTGPKTTFTYQTPGKRTVTLKTTDASGASSSVSRDVEVSGPNVPPTASFAASPNPATVNTQVVFDATASRDSDGSIVRYEWDLDGNGSFETNSGSNPRTQRAYAAAGVINVRLRATDNSGASTEALRQLTVTSSTGAVKRVAPRSLSARTTPSRDRKLPFVYKTSGRLRLPGGVARMDGCAGRVTVTFKVGKKTISRRTTALRSNCAYRTSVTFRDRKRIGRRTRLRVIVRFQGNRFLTPKSARTRSVRIG